jgi:hypothetical protein
MENNVFVLMQKKAVTMIADNKNVYILRFPCISDHCLDSLSFLAHE